MNVLIFRTGHFVRETINYIININTFSVAVALMTFTEKPFALTSFCQFVFFYSLSLTANDWRIKWLCVCFTRSKFKTCAQKCHVIAEWISINSTAFLGSLATVAVRLLCKLFFCLFIYFSVVVQCDKDEQKKKKITIITIK